MTITAATFQPTTTRREDIELDADALDLQQAAALYRTHGCFVV